MKANSTGIWESRLRLYPDVFLGMFICLPPIAEQVTLIEMLDEQLSAFDALIAEASRGIQLLDERRTALISAAVTGKIKVTAD